MIPGIPTMTLFDTSKNYPRGILREIDVSLLGVDYAVMFYPECHEVLFAHRHRWAESEEVEKENFKLKLQKRINIHLDSWNLDDISSMKTDGTILPEDYWKDDDIEKIEEMLKWQSEDLQKMYLDAEELINRVPEKEEMEEWVNAHSFTKEEEEFYDSEIADMNLHHLRASAGPPTGEYLMNVVYDNHTGLPDKDKHSRCWRTEEWCPEAGRLSLISLPEDYGCFSTFNPKFKPFGIQWPKQIVDKTDDECNERRFSGLQSCGRWMEFMMDNRGRFVANGFVKEFHKFTINSPLWGCTVETEYGKCIVPEHLVTKNKLEIGEEVKLLCRDNEVCGEVPIICSKVIRSGTGACEDFAPCGLY